LPEDPQMAAFRKPEAASFLHCAIAIAIEAACKNENASPGLAGSSLDVGMIQQRRMRD